MSVVPHSDKERKTLMHAELCAVFSTVFFSNSLSEGFIGLSNEEWYRLYKVDS